MSLAKHYTNFGDTKGQPPEENTLGWASRGGILGGYASALSMQETWVRSQVGNILHASWLKKKKKTKKTIRIHKCSLNEKR